MMNLSRKRTTDSECIGIIGAGPSGLAASLFLKTPCEILERTDHVGGHAASFFEQGFTFDYGPHILFSRDPVILEFIIATLGDNVSKCRRNNKILFKNSILKYPFENDLASLPIDDNYECIQGFMINPYKEKYAVPQNMREWFLKTFGEGICSKYLFPYNEKIWHIPIEQLAMDLAERIPNPPPEDVLKSSLGYNTEGYLHQLYYFYPQTGGYQAISEAWKKHASITYRYDVERIELLNNRRIKLIDLQGRTREYSRVISTMPVHELITKLELDVPTEIKQSVDQLIVNPMFVASFGVRGVDLNQYTAVYFPDPNFLVNRISYPCTFSATNGPNGHWSLQAEIVCTKTSPIWQKTNADVLAYAKSELQQRHLLPANEDIVFERVDRQDRSYVVYDVNYANNVSKVREWFAAQGIHLLGRFGYFEYINVDMAVSRAIQLAMELNGESSSFSQLKSHYLERALTQLRGIPVES